MAQNSWPFASGSGTAVGEDQWSMMARLWADSGVVDGVANELQVYGDSSGRQVKVKTGRATVRGHFYENTAEVTLAIGANASGSPRIDRVVLTLDPTANTVVLAVVAGTPAGSPSAPALTQTDVGVYQVTLAQVLVVSGATTIAVGDVTDERVYVSASLPKTGGTLTGDLTLDSGGALDRWIRFTDEGVTRWRVGFGGGTGIDALIVERFDDTGDYVDRPFYVEPNGRVQSASHIGGKWTGTISGIGGVAVITLPESPTGNWSVTASVQTIAGYSLAVVFGTTSTSASIAVYVMDGFGGLVAQSVGQSATIHYHAIAY